MGFEAQPGGQRRRGLGGPAQVRYVDGRDRLVRQPVGDALRLVTADGVERGVAMPVHQRERVILARGADSPWRTSSSSQAPGGRRKRSCR